MTQANTADAAARLREAVKKVYEALDIRGMAEWNLTHDESSKLEYEPVDNELGYEGLRELTAAVTAYEAELARLNSRIKELENLLLGGE